MPDRWKSHGSLPTLTHRSQTTGRSGARSPPRSGLGHAEAGPQIDRVLRVVRAQVERGGDLRPDRRIDLRRHVGELVVDDALVQGRTICGGSTPPAADAVPSSE